MVYAGNGGNSWVVWDAPEESAPNSLLWKPGVVHPVRLFSHRLARTNWVLCSQCVLEWVDCQPSHGCVTCYAPLTNVPLLFPRRQ